MKASTQTNKLNEALFGLSDKQAKLRSRARTILVLGACLILGIISAIIVGRFFFLGETSKTWIIVGARFLKYFTLLWVVNHIALKKAAHYLNDIFEINQDDAATNFIKSLVFGHGKGHIGWKNADQDPVSGKNRIKLGIIYNEEKISITDRKIPEADQHSPLLLIGGPGALMVGLDQLVVFEKFNGEHAIYHSNDKPWNIEKFERIREVGNQQYAIISLCDQFIKGISVKTRTKDGISIKAQDIKVIFSVLRRIPGENFAKSTAARLYDPEAIKSLVYNQTIIRSEISETFGAVFPWENVVLLVVSEIEDLIKTSTLSEILGNIGQKEIAAREEAEETILAIKTELANSSEKSRYVSVSPSVNFKSRSATTTRFHEPDFIKKATQAGVQLHWIDIGTWKISSEKIMEKHKEAWNLSQKNADQKTKFELEKNKKTQKAFADLINDIIIHKYKTPSSSLKFRYRRSENKEYYEYEDEDGDEDEDGYRSTQSERYQQENTENKPENLTKDILKSIRQELLAGDMESPQQNASVKEAVKNALQYINLFLSHIVGRSK